MSNLNVLETKGRRRALSINSIDADHQHAMDSSLDNLQQDLSLISSQWNKVINEHSNPLELSLAFLDDTSVGLSHRYQEFTQLKEKIGSHLRLVVGEHSQAFNSNVASYSKTVLALTDAQENTTQIKKNLNEANEKITVQKESLMELNNESLKLTNSIESLSYIEELLQIPEKIEGCMRKEDFKEVQNLLERGFVLSNTNSLKSLEQLKPIHQQLEIQEHVLFQNMIDEIHDIVYSKKGNLTLDTNILETISVSQNGFTSLENYLYNIVNIDLMKQSVDLNKKLLNFITNVKIPGFFQTIATVNSGSNSDYTQLFALLSMLKDINKLPLALNILVDRASVEIHNIMIKATEAVRSKHPTLLKMVKSIANENSFGLSIKNLLSLIMRECFWEIFIKYLLVIQKHRAIYEIVNVLQTSSASSINKNYYRFDLIWSKLLHEVEQLITKYIYNPLLILGGDMHRLGRQAPVLPKRKGQKLFLLQNNVTDASYTKEHIGDLKALLKDIFVGFTVPQNIKLDSIYIEDESFEEEEPLIPASVFNMKVLLEPLLLFVQASSNLIPVDISQNSTPSIAFFSSFMEKNFYPRIGLTLDYVFSTDVESLNPYTLENINENQNIFKSAIDFQIFFYNMLYVFNSSNSFRPQMVKIILHTLEKFFQYYSSIFNSIIGSSASERSNRLTTAWFNDEHLKACERHLLKGDNSNIVDESKNLFKFCPKFHERGNDIGEDSTLNLLTLDTVIYFTSTVSWIMTWLPSLKSLIESSSNTEIVSLMNADELRSHWSFFEYMDIENSNKMMSLRILLDSENSEKFDSIVQGFEGLELDLMTLLRFDIRAESIYNIGKFFQETTSWDLEVGSIELYHSISSLISRLRTTENKLSQQLSEDGKDKIFAGIDVVSSQAFILGAFSINVINENGIKKILRNVNLLQHTIRNLCSEPSNISMANTIAFYSLISQTENVLIQKINDKELPLLTKDDFKNILRLQFSEEIDQQVKRQNSMSANNASKPVNRRYNEALKKIEALNI
ncbi:similar to Saccharomyces cerevisiae YPR055W SEC8 Essential 121kDa subunit of the exocyst complex [Maudiozyma barnettii]|uniref:Exocyst complex component Sec8 n=1 Tax=Maudiozyma barnettii TaxID=61262 RepID=A0A8H2VD42_9SACH|nr:exocyst subunit SEC8 [Kazachstania barnettii]CAB4253086.1 similar to Saccharomyces cerevisiae YPR055W SEC8 Essential 121kDa subunit of the exocyst complex [Kazachstania barnettii]CAD1780379.1 similar to Saccharomyces cerevisiae YPR055W SEC8 Essential 121kDa subunit of the exocyst complex [Kazachstania barnettii]